MSQATAHRRCVKCWRGASRTAVVCPATVGPPAPRLGEFYHEGRNVAPSRRPPRRQTRYRPAGTIFDGFFGRLAFRPYAQQVSRYRIVNRDRPAPSNDLAEDHIVREVRRILLDDRGKPPT